MAFHVSKTSILNTLDYIEDGRADIYKWSETRQSNRKGIRGKLYSFKKLFIDKTILRSFVHNLTIIVFLQMALAALGTFMCQTLRLDFDVHMSIFVSPIVFPLAFSINADFQRRERVLEDLAQFKGALVVLFFCHRDWLQSSGLPKDFLKTVNTKLKGLVLNIKEYLLTEKLMRRNFILSVIYEDLSDISQLNDKIRCSSLPHNSPLLTRLIHYHNLMCHAFERLRVIREYRSPRTIRSFTKVFIFLMPIVLSPYYVHMGIKSGNMWSPYYIAVLTSFIFGTLQGVQDVLDDPFDGISEDDINLGQLEDWTAQSLLTNRTITIGRFTVTTKGKEKMELSDSDDDDGPSPMILHPPKVQHKRKPILRKPSFRRVEHGEENPDQAHRKLSLYPETASRLEDLTRRGLTGSTTILPGMKLKRSNSDSLTASNSRASLAQEFFRAQGMDSSGRDSKKVSFSTGTRGLSDDQGESDNEDSVFVSPRSHSDPSKYSRPSWMLDENEPLLISLDSRSGSSETGTSSLNTPEMNRRALPEDLFEGLKNSPGTNLVDMRFSVNKKKGKPPLASLFDTDPGHSVDSTDGPAPPEPSQPASMPSSLQNLFGPPRNPNKEVPAPSGGSSLPERPRPRVLPISPLARPESPPTSRSNVPSLPASRISRSAPTSPEQERWNAFRGISAPLTPSPEDAVAIPLKSVTRKTSADIPVRKKSSDSTSGNSRFAVNAPAQTPAVENVGQVSDDPLPTSKRKKSSDISSLNSRFAVNTSAQTPAVDNSTQVPLAPEKSGTDDSTTASKPIDMPRSRFNVARPTNDVINAEKPREDQPLVTSGFPNYGVTDPSPPQSVQSTPSSRFKVNSPRKTSQQTVREGEEETKPDSFQLLTLDGDSTEVFI
ncbi:uncharacterized protein LOC144656007 [Oculina patagonica]